MTIPMTTQPLGWWLNGEAGIPDSGERAPFLCTRCWCQLCSLPSPPASLLAHPHLLLSEVKSRASCLYVAARRSAQIVCLPRAPSLVSGGLVGAPVQPKPPHTEGPTGRLRDPGVSPQNLGRREGAGSRLHQYPCGQNLSRVQPREGSELGSPESVSW